MALPIRTTLDDIRDICAYFAAKPTGATIAEAKTVLDSKRLDGRKLAALKFWGLIAEDGDRLKASPEGRELTKGNSWLSTILSGVIRNVQPYCAIVERAGHRQEQSMTATEVAAHWHEHFRGDVGESDSIVNDQAVCFFNVAEGAGLGVVVQGRRGSPTRFEFDDDKVHAFIHGASSSSAKSVRATTAPELSVLPAAAPIRTVRPATNGETENGTRVVQGTHLQRGLMVDCYKLIDRLGSGFSAEVWSATVEQIPPGVDLTVGQRVAMKFYSANALAIPDQVIRVEREYRLAQRLRHPHLIRIYEFLLASPRPNHNFLVMDIAAGPSLSGWLKDQKFESDEILKIIAQIFSGADALHAAGALHRDIKPGNISIARDEEGNLHTVLLDLGIVSSMYEKSVTAVSRFVGSKHWAPLEQLIGDPLDERSDIYSIGAVAYNMFVGVEPFSRSATEAAVAVEMSRQRIAIPELASLPAEVTDMLNNCLSINRAERPRTASECLAVLQRHGVVP
jgi:tRNA A-37 threonylcarbamoyl transferase component Bud32